MLNLYVGIGHAILRFNSKLVRLKVAYHLTREHYGRVFQFQTGAIKSCNACPICSCTLCLFQFQTGAIKRFVVYRIGIKGEPFQFQTGAIKS